MDDDLLLAVKFQRCRDGRPLPVDEFHEAEAAYWRKWNARRAEALSHKSRWNRFVHDGTGGLSLLEQEALEEAFQTELRGFSALLGEQEAKVEALEEQALNERLDREAEERKAELLLEHEEWKRAFEEKLAGYKARDAERRAAEAVAEAAYLASGGDPNDEDARDEFVHDVLRAQREGEQDRAIADAQADGIELDDGSCDEPEDEDEPRPGSIAWRLAQPRATREAPRKEPIPEKLREKWGSYLGIMLDTFEGPEQVINHEPTGAAFSDTCLVCGCDTRPDTTVTYKTLTRGYYKCELQHPSGELPAWWTDWELSEVVDRQVIFTPELAGGGNTWSTLQLGTKWGDEVSDLIPELRPAEEEAQ